MVISIYFIFFRQDFVDFAHTSKEILSGKLISGAVTSENQIRGVRTCIDNIEALLQTPNCLKPTVKPILNLEKYQDPLKVRIAETIINHFKELAPNGEDISQSHLDNLVLSEFNRIQEDAQQQQQQLQGECYQNQRCTVIQLAKNCPKNQILSVYQNKHLVSIK